MRPRCGDEEGLAPLALRHPNGTSYSQATRMCTWTRDRLASGSAANHPLASPKRAQCLQKYQACLSIAGLSRDADRRRIGNCPAAKSGGIRLSFLIASLHSQYACSMTLQSHFLGLPLLKAAYTVE